MSVYQATEGFTGSDKTMSSVQIGPRSNEASHQFNPLRPLACANPELMSERVNHPTAYSLVLEIFGIEPPYTVTREYPYYKNSARLEKNTVTSCENTFPDRRFLINQLANDKYSPGIPGSALEPFRVIHLLAPLTENLCLVGLFRVDG
jgi:hypothetical protein